MSLSCVVCPVLLCSPVLKAAALQGPAQYFEHLCPIHVLPLIPVPAGHLISPCPCLQNESKLLFFVAVVIWAKTKKTGQRGLLPYLSTTYTYLKLLNLVLWFYADPVKGIIYLVLATSESPRRDC